MLLRLLSCSARRSFQTPVRTLRTSVIALAGHDHHEPTPVYHPKPATGKRGIFGNEKTPSSMYEKIPHTPGPDDYASYFGAGVGVLLTVLAVTFYTDVFGMNRLKKDDHSAHKKTHVVEEKKEAVKPAVAKTEVEPVVDTKEEADPVVEEDKKVEETEVEPNGPATTAADEIPAKNEKDDHPDQTKAAEPASVEEEEAKPRSPDATSQEISPASESDTAELTTRVTEKMPESVEYLLVGAGTASYYAALAIRARDADAKVLMIGDETHLPYNRPPLSKELWWYGDKKAKETLEYKALSGKKRDVFFESKGFFVPCGELSDTRHGGVSLAQGRRVVRLCPDEKKAFLDDGTVISYNKCLIATGSKPKTLPELERASADVKQRVLYFRGVDDYRKLEQLCSDAKSITIVGGGFLGSELAYGIKRKYGNIKINQVISESGHLANVLPEFLSKKAAESIRRGGVNVVTNSKISGAKKSGDQIELQLTGGSGPKSLQSDYVLVAIGVEPDTSLAEASGLEIDPVLGGVSADAELRVRSGIYSAGDACSFYDRSLGRRRVEHWENAQISGRLAGENMTGAEKAFWYQPSFFTKISPQHHINAVGNTDSSLRTVSVFAKEEDGAVQDYERGVVFYRGIEDRIVGVLLVNVFGSSVDVARRLIEEARPVEDYRELAKLFPLYTNPKKDEDEQE